MTFVQRIKECLIRLVLRLIRIFGLNNAVVLEMEPKTDSTLAVYQEMLRRSWNKRYRIILLTANPDNLRHLRTKGVSIIRIEYSPIKVVSFMKHLLARMRAVLVLYQFVQMGKKNPETILVYLTCFLQAAFGKSCRQKWRMLHLQNGESCRHFQIGEFCLLKHAAFTVDSYWGLP